jgi:two-component system chemotaxis response regulator CheB
VRRRAASRPSGRSSPVCRRTYPPLIYVAPGDRHLLVLNGRAHLSQGPTENGHRPAVDPLFRSAARAADRRTVAVVLSGSRDDGTAGAATVAARGGRVVVQDPEDAIFPSMPRSVIEHVVVDRVCTAANLGPAVVDMLGTLRKAAEPAALSEAAEELMAQEAAMANLDNLTTEDMAGTPSGLACPTCHGGLFELPGEPTPRFRCWVGHAWSPESLLEEQAAAFEGALWMALRSLEEKAALARRMGESADLRGLPGAAARYHEVGANTDRASDLIRELIRRVSALNALAGDPGGRG